MKKKSNRKENTLTKFNRIIDKVISGLNKFSNEMNKVHIDPDAGDKNLDRITRGLNNATGTNHNYDVLTGQDSKRLKGLI